MLLQPLFTFLHLGRAHVLLCSVYEATNLTAVSVTWAPNLRRTQGKRCVTFRCESLILSRQFARLQQSTSIHHHHQQLQFICVQSVMLMLDAVHQARTVKRH